MTRPPLFSETLAARGLTQAARELNLTRRAVVHRIAAGTLAATKVGEARTNAYIIERAEVERIKHLPPPREGQLMSIDPNTLPDGTVVEMDDGYLRFKDGDGRQPTRGDLGDGDPYRWGGRIIVRTYTPDPTPDQEVPRDEWANIAVGSRVRIVEVDGDEHTVTVDYVSPAADVVWLYDEDHDYDGAKIARVYLLDALTPPDPDADLIEAMARTVRAAKGYESPWSDVEEDLRENYRVSARAALAALREHEAKS
ncbi:MAG TPA: hypothetical protein PLX57_14025 [Ornithinibacter sp.]|nr:hypothetical protein [Ornithinibacter sp.]